MLFDLDEVPVTLRGEPAYVAENATIVGSVTIERDVSVWFNAVIRADSDRILIGRGSNIQDGAVLHVDPGFPLEIGEDVSVGHKAMLHGCRVGDGSLIGINAVVLNGAVIGRECLIGANALVPEGKEIPDRSLVVGTPCKVLRTLSDEEVTGLRKNAEGYVERGHRYERGLRANTTPNLEVQAEGDTPMWKPRASQVAKATMSAFLNWANDRYDTRHASYAELYDWSITETEQFWTGVWDFCDLRASIRGDTVVQNGKSMPGARWFPDARLNYAENMLRAKAETDAVVFWGEDRIKRRLTHRELYDAVSRFAQALTAAGVAEGDRVTGYLPNIPETLVAMLATASLGAIWSSTSPDFGVQGVLDRFGQIEPKILICADGYVYGGKRHDSLSRVAEIAAALPSVEHVVVVEFMRNDPDVSNIRGAVRLADFIAPHASKELTFAQVAFDHPLFILYSSGTTGVPKCIVHGHGGVLLQHLKEHTLHSDVKAGDRVFYYTTCGWMMWNWLASALAVGATVLLYDGSPFADEGRILFDYAEAEGMTHFGTSAKYLDALAKTGFKPRESHSLQSLRTIMSSGSPLAPDSFDFVYRDVKSEVCLSSISGGTDIVSCFALGNPVLPVWRGELQCLGLGLAVEVWDESGRPVRSSKGELVCVKPFPAMPIGFWNDPQGTRYRAAYFERYSGVWCQGDFCELTAHDGLIIYGRSDAVLNPGGVRIGTAEIYRQVEKLPEVLESIAIGQAWENDVRVVLFVKLREGLTLDETLIANIRHQIRANTTPRHVPAKILQVTDIPRTKSGKIVELAVRKVVHGEAVTNIDALANPDALSHFRSRAELRS
ncbi:acetoacetate--CoA ligase [Paraburkholderia sp. RL17-373-BIF-A]|uniref:acetoacetate--CoA ligase n=1 Tax=Paraburkholderia sp. RL17-373-BIF-A TaxID=3031629 RepID=UPI0038B8CD49